VNTEGDTVELENIPQNIMEASSVKAFIHIKSHLSAESSLKGTLTQIEKNIIEDALKLCNNNKAEAAKMLGIPRMSLYRKLKDNFM